MLRYFVLIAGLAVMPFTYAANQQTEATTIAGVTNWIGSINVPNETLYIATSSTQIVNPGICSNSSRYVLLPASTISRSMILAAFAAQSKVVLNIGGGGCSSDNRPLIVSLSLVQ